MRGFRALFLLALAGVLRFFARGPLWLADACQRAAVALEAQARLDIR